MKLFIRRFKLLDVVSAADEEDAKIVDWSDAADGINLVEVEELTKDEFDRRWAKNWSQYVPAGINNDGLSLAEAFADTKEVSK